MKYLVQWGTVIFWVLIPPLHAAAQRIVIPGGPSYEYIPEETAGTEMKQVLSKEPKYAVIVASDGNEIKGFVSIDEQGGLRLTGNTHLPDPYILNPEEIRTMRLLPKVVIRNKKGEVILGYVLREKSEAMVIETLLEPRTVMEVKKTEIDNVVRVKSVVVSRQDSVHRLGLAGSYLFRQSGLAGKIDAGFSVSLSYDLDFKQLFGWEKMWIPHLRVRGSFLMMNNDPYKYQAIAPQAGPMWLIRFFPKRYGQFYLSVLGGVSFEKIESPVVVSSATSISASGEFGYEIPVGNFFFCLGTRIFFSPDSKEHFIAPGAQLGVIYGW